jgi:hypothetical protein
MPGRAGSLYPGKPLKVPEMIMRGAYGHIQRHRQNYHGTALLVDVAMYRMIPDAADALFSVGYAGCEEGVWENVVSKYAEHWPWRWLPRPKGKRGFRATRDRQAKD